MMADWSSLPADLAVLVAQRLTVYADHIRFGAACTAWRSAARARDGRPRAFQPYLLKDMFTRFSGTVALHSPSGGKILHAPVPESDVHVFDCIASSQGWLLVTDTLARVFLFDPLSNSRVDLPRCTYSPNPDIPVSQRRRRRPKRKFLLQGCIASDGTHTVMVSYYDNLDDPGFGYKLEYARPGDEEWTPITTPGPRDRLVPYDSICHHEGKFYVVDHGGIVMAIEITISAAAAAAVTRTYSVATGIMEPHRDWYTITGRKFIVFTPCGEMLLFQLPTFPVRKPADFATFVLDGTVWKRVHPERVLRDLQVFACSDLGGGSIFSIPRSIPLSGLSPTWGQLSDHVALYTCTDDDQWRLHGDGDGDGDGDDGAPLAVGIARSRWIWFAPTYKKLRH